MKEMRRDGDNNKVSVKNRLMLFGKWFGRSGSGFCFI